jgi:hypothetical protein
VKRKFESEVTRVRKNRANVWTIKETIKNGCSLLKTAKTSEIGRWAVIGGRKDDQDKSK